MGVTTNKLAIGVAALVAAATGVLGAGTGAVPAPQPAAAESQYWLGVIEVPSRRAVQQIAIAITLDRVWSPQGDQWSGRFDLTPGPSAAGLRGVPLSDVIVDGQQIRFTTPSQAGDATYNLMMTPDGTRAEGQMGTSMGAMAVRLRRVSPEVARDAVIRRPQEPTGTYGYQAREVFVPTTDGVNLFGTLTSPANMSPANPAPGVVLVGDLGAMDRDLAGAYHRPFLVLADALTKAGFAVLRLDDRGIGQSGGDERVVTPQMAATDAAGALSALAGMEGVDPTRVGYIGFGEGAVTSAIAATDDLGGAAKTRPAFMVLISPRGLPLIDSQLRATELALEREGETGEYVKARVAARKRALEAAAASTTPYDAVGQPEGPIADALRDELKAYASFGRGEISPMQETQGVVVQMAEMTTLQYVSRYRHDPAPVYERVGVPVLVLGMGEDMTNPSKENVAAVLAALRKHADPQVTSASFEGLNQVMQPCVTGLAAERLQIETTVDPRVLNSVTQWLRRTAKVEK